MTLAPLAAALLLAASPAPGKAKKKAARPPRGQATAIGAVQPAGGAPLAPRPVGVRPLDSMGTVRNVVRQRAFLDAGSKDGLSVGQSVALSRKGHAAGTCTVEAVTERNAVCSGPDARAGDTFAVNPRATGALPTPLPPRPSAEEQARRLAALQAATFAPVESKGKTASTAPERTRRVEVGVAHASWLGVEATTLSHEMVWAAVRDAPVLGGARLNLDLTAAWRTSPNDERYQPGRQATVWVREASLSWTDRSRPFMLAAGRVLPWRLPGGPTFDGIQVGWRPSGGSELGLFGGAVPDPLTTAPGLDRATAGAYGAFEAAAGKSVFRTEARVAWLKLPASKSRIEAEATAQAWLARQVDVSAQARVGLGDYTSPGKLDAARLDLGWYRPGQLSLSGGLRYDENRIPDAAAPALYPGRARHAWGALGWDGLGWLQLRATGGFSRDVAAGVDRTWVGPEASAPRLFGRWGGLAAGYAEEIGYLSGRSAWLQADLALARSTRLLARLHWMMDARLSPLQAMQNAGTTLGLVSDLAPWLRLRVSASARVGLAVNEGASTDWAAEGFAGLEARY